MESQVSQPIEEALNTIEGIKELRSVNGAGHPRSSSSPSNSNRDIDVAAQDVRDRVATVVRESAARYRSAHHRQGRQRPVPGPVHCPLREPFAAGVDGDRRQDRQDPARTLRRAWARWTSSAGWSAPSTSGWTRTAWPPTRFPSRRCATPWSGKTPTCPAATSPAAAGADAAHHGAPDRSQGVQRPGGRHAQRLAHPRAGHRLGGGRHQGAALHVAP